MKSEKAREYLRRHRVIVYSSLADLVADNVNSLEAARALEIAEEELELRHRAVIWRLKEIRTLLSQGDSDEARLAINNLLIDMNDV